MSSGGSMLDVEERAFHDFEEIDGELVPVEPSASAFPESSLESEDDFDDFKTTSRIGASVDESMTYESPLAINTGTATASENPFAAETANAASDATVTWTVSSTARPSLEEVLDSVVDSSSHGSHVSVGVLAAVICSALFGVIALSTIAFICLRRRRRRRRTAAAAAAAAATGIVTEMETRGQGPSTHAYYYAPPGPVPSGEAFRSAPVLAPVPVQPLNISSAPPNASYFTGIDTSDMLSVRDNRTSFSVEGGQDDPPPPYQPANVPSRNSSLRRQLTSNVSRPSEASLIAHRVENARSPFADPVEEEDDAVSDISEPAGDGEGPMRGAVAAADVMSAVSDLSYQDEHEGAGRAL